MKRFVRKVEVIPSPNIWYHVDAYELENHAQDVDGEIWRILAETVSWQGGVALDIGCGDGFHLARFAETASSVIGVEPHPPLVRRAERRVAALGNVVVRRGTAQRIPLADASVDVAHARTAYFFGPGCEPGLSEIDRVLRPGGRFVIVDLDTWHSPYGDWMRADLPHYDPDAVDEFFASAGFCLRRVETRWRFADRESMESVLRIEFSPGVAERAVAETVRRGAGLPGPLELPVGYRVLVRDKPTGLVHSSSAGVSPRMP
ncbi:class I SAM-dependent methyltransferase [Prauserella cavernicola]|uniref:Methyltransferase domain-containing protein n=1 Tax=Prauserella cavernicola TaxID=2800127 RepID=A0A934QWT0_9PSEU|nr:methyltransferase domain-containing protein [Prauserella cavernicola]MBK1786743.1 methyltransferase domain-containing protein [Prauserella cavernicola]